MRRIILGLFTLLAASSLSAQSKTSIPLCQAPFERLLGPAFFNRYPAKPVRLSKPATPVVSKGQAHLFRTVIREQAKMGPDFAGHFTIVRIGCGAGMVCLAIADALTGRVFFSPKLRNVFIFRDANVERLNYRRDSRLLIVAGSPNEDVSREGLSYYLWQDDKFHLIRFISSAELCKN
ncbi:MAG TPA: hypothetical protein VIC34_10160 [Croceibacterium sp.]|jgi:hypothetical protein